MAGEIPAISVQVLCKSTLVKKIERPFGSCSAHRGRYPLHDTDNQFLVEKNRLSLREETAVIRRSNTSVCIAAIVCALASLVTAASAQEPLTRPEGLPEWAFNIPDKEQPSAVRPEGIVRAPGSAREYEWAKVSGNTNPPDWFPEEHLPAPPSVAGGPGRRFACGACHLMSGQGHPESADLAGLPAEYLIRQMAYYKAGTRKDETR